MEFRFASVMWEDKRNSRVIKKSDEKGCSGGHGNRCRNGNANRNHAHLMKPAATRQANRMANSAQPNDER